MYVNVYKRICILYCLQSNNGLKIDNLSAMNERIS